MTIVALAGRRVPKGRTRIRVRDNPHHLIHCEIGSWKWKADRSPERPGADIEKRRYPDPTILLTRRFGETGKGKGVGRGTECEARLHSGARAAATSSGGRCSLSHSVSSIIDAATWVREERDTSVTMRCGKWGVRERGSEGSMERGRGRGGEL